MVGKENRGDVDFCFLRNKTLFNLDMKSWRRSSDYHIGHHHTIQNRLDTLEKQMTKVEKRGKALQVKLREDDFNVQNRLDLLIVPFPEYLAFDRPNLWYGDQPRVISVEELVGLVNAKQPLSVKT